MYIKFLVSKNFIKTLNTIESYYYCFNIFILINFIKF